MAFLGKSPKTQMAGHGQFACSFCRRLSMYVLLDVQYHFYLFGLPVWRVGPPDSIVVCGACQGVLPGEVLNATDSYPIDWPPTSHLQDRPKPRLDGERVLARWPFDEFWYPACVRKRDDDRVYVHYDDGHKACLPEEQVEALEFDVGDRVYARWKRGAFYYPAEITRKEGERIHIEYDDGRWEETTISAVRVLRDVDEKPYERYDRHDRY